MDEEYLSWPCAEPREDRLSELLNGTVELVDALIPLPRTPVD